jgi:predicted outer membrane protein
MKITWIMLASLLLCSPLALAQESTAKPADDKATTKDANHAEKEIAAIKLTECRNEVELAKFAQQKATSPEVKEFAARMIKDHGEACRDLEKWAGDYRPAATRSDVDDNKETSGDDKEKGARLELQTKKGATVGVDFQARKSGSGSGSFDWVAIHQEMSNKCLAVAKKELGEKEGAAFDKCYMGMQLAAHQKMIIADEVLAKHVSEEAREKLEKCKATATEHLQAAKTIMKSLEGQPDGKKQASAR